MLMNEFIQMTIPDNIPFLFLAEPEKHDQVRLPRHLLPHQEQKVGEYSRNFRRAKISTYGKKINVHRTQFHYLLIFRNIEK